MVLEDIMVAAAAVVAAAVVDITKADTTRVEVEAMGETDTMAMATVSVSLHFRKPLLCSCCQIMNVLICFILRQLWWWWRRKLQQYGPL